MQKRRKEGLPKLAKYGIVAFLLADALGIVVAYNKINQVPAPLADGKSDAFVLTEPALILPADRVAPPQIEVAPLAVADPAPRVAEARQGVLDLRPIDPRMSDDVLELDRRAEVAERPAVIPAVRFAAARPARRQTRPFRAAFARDIAPAVQTAAVVSEASLAEAAAPSEVPAQGELFAAESRLDTALVPAEAGPAPGAVAEATAPSVDVQPVIEAPAPLAGSEAVLPAS